VGVALGTRASEGRPQSRKAIGPSSAEGSTEPSRFTKPSSEATNLLLRRLPRGDGRASVVNDPFAARALPGFSRPPSPCAPAPFGGLCWPTAAEEMLIAMARRKNRADAPPIMPGRVLIAKKTVHVRARARSFSARRALGTLGRGCGSCLGNRWPVAGDGGRARLPATTGFTRIRLG